MDSKASRIRSLPKIKPLLAFAHSVFMRIGMMMECSYSRFNLFHYEVVDQGGPNILALFGKQSMNSDFGANTDV